MPAEFRDPDAEIEAANSKNNDAKMSGHCARSLMFMDKTKNRNNAGLTPILNITDYIRRNCF